MRKKTRKMSLPVYVLASVFVCLLYFLGHPRFLEALTIYQLDLYMSYKDVTSLVLYGMPLLSLIFAAITYRTRNTWSVIVNASLPIMIFLSLVVAQNVFWLFATVYAVILWFFVIQAYYVYCTMLDNDSTKGFFYLMGRNFRMILFGVLMIVILPSYIYLRNSNAVNAADYIEELHTEIEQFERVKAEEGTYTYPDEFENFEESKWSDMDFKDRYNLIFKVFEMETEILNTEGVRFQAKKLSDSDGTYGLYSDMENTLYIDAVHLANDDAYNCINTVIHECRHAYQYYSIKVLVEMQKKDIDYHGSAYFDEVEKWWNADLSYLFMDNYADYYENELEYDARAYAEERMADYEDFLK